MTNAHSCLAEIEALSHETSSDKRRQVLNRVADLFVITNDQQSREDVDAFGSVMERVAYELEVEARAELSKRLCEVEKAPHDLVRKLASDDICVARPVLERSGALTDKDLIEIARTRGQSHMHAISKRPTLSSPVTDVILEHGENAVLVEVTRNDGAEFSSSGLGVLTAKAWQNSDLLTALGSRSDLSEDLVGKIKQRVAQRLKQEMGSKNAPSDITNVDALIDRSTATLDIDGLEKSNAELTELANNKQLNEGDLVALAKAGRLSETVHALSVLTGLDHRMISHCFLKAEITALGIVCKANGFKSQTFLAFAQTRNGKNGIDARAIAHAMRDYDKLSQSNAKRTLRFLKVRNSIEGGGEKPSDPKSEGPWRDPASQAKAQILA